MPATRGLRTGRKGIGGHPRPSAGAPTGSGATSRAFSLTCLCALRRILYSALTAALAGPRARAGGCDCRGRAQTAGADGPGAFSIKAHFSPFCAGIMRDISRKRCLRGPSGRLSSSERCTTLYPPCPCRPLCVLVTAPSHCFVLNVLQAILPPTS